MQDIILSCLLYSSKTYTLYSRHIQRLSQIHLRHLRAIFGIRWSDQVTNNEILQHTDMPSIEAVLLNRQITWTGIVVRINDDRLPKKGRRWRTIAVHSGRPSKKEPQKPKPKEQPMPKSNDVAAVNVRSRLQIEQISSQSSHADTAEGNWQLVLANYPKIELMCENVERFAMLMSYPKPRRPPMILSAPPRGFAYKKQGSAEIHFRSIVLLLLLLLQLLRLKPLSINASGLLEYVYILPAKLFQCITVSHFPSIVTV